jgi:hypothetical protein
MGIATTMIGLPAAVAAGVIESVRGGNFAEGFDKVSDIAQQAIDGAKDFGDRHSSTITKTVVSSIVSGVVGHVTGDVIHNRRPHDPPAS